MPEPDNQQTPTPEPTEGTQTPPAANPPRDPIAELQAMARAKHAPGTRVRARRNEPRFLLIVFSLAAALLVGGTLIGYGVTHLGSGARRTAPDTQAAQEASQQQAALEESQQAAQEASQQASQAASQQAGIAEGSIVSARIASLKTMNAELDSIMAALNAKAKASASASKERDRKWAARQDAYSSAYASVSAHNASERRRYLASKTEVARNGELVVTYTYHPSYRSYPSRPSKPAALKASVDAEKTRLTALQTQIDALVTSIGSEAASATSFAPVYPVLDDAAKALKATVTDASRMASRVVVTKKSKGQVIDASKIAAVKLSVLDAPFAQLDRSFVDTLTSLGLTADQVSASGVTTP